VRGEGKGKKKECEEEGQKKRKGLIDVLFSHVSGGHEESHETPYSEEPASHPGERGTGTHCMWVGLGAGLDAVENRKILPLPGIEPRPSSPSLYRLSYPVIQNEMAPNNHEGTFMNTKMKQSKIPFPSQLSLDMCRKGTAIHPMLF
jgi:hypothetical protein